MKEQSQGTESVTSVSEGLSSCSLDDLWREIEQRMGVCPSFFKLAQAEPAIAEKLFEQAKFAYLDSPLPALLKETLFTYLSRFCRVRYCVSRHAAFLLGKGCIAGDPESPGLPLEKVKDLLTEQLPAGEQLPVLLEEMKQSPPLDNWPGYDSRMGWLLRVACSRFFVVPEQAVAWCQALRRLLGPARYEQLMLFLSFVRTAHFWTEVHPELELENDVEDLFREQEALAGLLIGGDERDVTEEAAIGHSLRQELLELSQARAMHEDLKETKERFETLANNMSQLAWMKDAEGNTFWFNKRWYDYTGTSFEEVAGWRWRKVHHPDHVDRVEESLRSSLASGKPWDITFPLRGADGSYRWFLTRAVPIRDGDGSIVRWFGTNTDITPQLEVEQALRKSEEKARDIVESMTDGLVTLDREWRITYINPRSRKEVQAQRIDSDSLIGRDFWEAFPHLKDTDLERYFRQALQEQAPLQFERCSKNRWFDVRISPSRDGGLSIYFLEITQQKQLEADLRRMGEDLAEANQRKDEFLATLAHELRNPLAPIRTGLELIRMAADDPDMISKTRQMMERQADLLIMLVNDLLDISRITRGKLELRKRRVLLSEVVQTAVEASMPFIEESRHTLEVDFPPQETWIEADPNRLSQVFSNLLNNSAKYTPAGGRISFAAQLEEGEVVISVNDTGIGIPPEQRTRIFELFAQLDRPQEKGHTGLGIGLTLVKSLVEMHKGSVTAESEGANQGSTFTVRLPVCLDDQGENDERNIGKAEPSAKGARVLIVDDNRAAAESLSQIIELYGNHVRTAFDGQEACECAAAFRPDLILMDLGMPKMSGFEAARFIRSQPWGTNLMLVALSGWGQEEDRLRTSEAGFDAHLVKPVESASLLRLLESLTNEAYHAS